MERGMSRQDNTPDKSDEITISEKEDDIHED